MHVCFRVADATLLVDQLQSLQASAVDLPADAAAAMMHQQYMHWYVRCGLCLCSCRASARETQPIFLFVR